MCRNGVARLRPMRLNRRIVTFLALVGSSAFCLALLVVRSAATDTGLWTWLAWNLVLAWIPFLLALAVYDGHRRRAPRTFLVPLSLLWLVFFPNAPYILTDFIHLEQPLAAPLWYD